jgi:hypothetical protein
MPTIVTSHEGTLKDEAAQERVADKLRVIAQSVQPRLRASIHEVDVWAQGDVLVLSVWRSGERYMNARCVHVKGVELVLMDFREDVHRFPFTFICQALPDEDATIHVPDRADV